MSARKSRSTSRQRSRISSNHTSRTSFGHSVDRKTKKPVFFDCHVCTLARQKLNRGEEFSQAQASALVERHAKKRQAHCHVYCLNDRLRFERNKTVASKPFREWVYYSEIKHFYLFGNRPEIFMLCVQSKTDGARYYETYKCKDSTDANKLCDLTFRACHDGEFILRDLTPTREISMVSQSSVRTHPMSNMELRASPIEAVHQKSVQNEPLLKSNPSPPDYMPKLPEIHCPILQVNKPKQGTDYRQQTSSADVTYLTYDPRNGAKVDESGAIYMFLEQIPNGDYPDDGNVRINGTLYDNY